MKVLFLNLPYKFPISRTSRWPEKTKSGTLYYPYWLCYAAGVCMKNGHEVDLVDCIAKGYSVEECINRVREFKPKYIVCEITTPTCVYDYKTIACIKGALSDAIVVAAGTHATALDESVLNECRAIDIVARQEYDFTIGEIITSGGDLTSVEGITYRDAEGHIVRNMERSWHNDMDDLPMVSKVYEKFLDVSSYGYSLAESPMVQIFSARGCPFHCNFCSYPETMGGRCYRKRSVNNFVDELEYISAHMPYVKEIFIEDDTFTIDRKRVCQICQEVLRRKLKIKWSCNTRADLPEKVMRLMKKAGCRLLVVGFESGNQDVLNETKKGIELENSIEFMKFARKNRLKVFGCFMIGLKGDNKNTIKETFEFAKKLNPDMVFFQQAVPFPHTEFYEWVKEQGYLITEDYNKWLDSDGTLRCLVDYPYASHTEIKKIRDDMMGKYYFSIGYILKTLIKNLWPSEFKRVSKAAISYIGFRVRQRVSG